MSVQKITIHLNVLHVKNLQKLISLYAAVK